MTWWRKLLGLPEPEDYTKEDREFFIMPDEVPVIENNIIEQYDHRCAICHGPMPFPIDSMPAKIRFTHPKEDVLVIICIWCYNKYVKATQKKEE